MFASRPLAGLRNAVRKALARPTPRKTTTRLGLEALDGRIVPATVTWTGGAGNLNWHAAANWSGGAVPGPTDDAVINVPTAGPVSITNPTWVRSVKDTTGGLALTGGSLVLSAASSVAGKLTLGKATLVAQSALTVGSLTQTDGVLTGRGTVTVAGPTVWTGGAMTGAGTTRADGGLRIGADDGAAHDVALGGRVLANARAAEWVGATRLYAEGDATLRNLPGATLTMKAGVQMTRNGSTGVGGVVDNRGTLVSDPGTGKVTVKLDAAFANTGTVRVLSGSLHLPSNGTVGGAMTVAAGADLHFGDNFNYAALAFTNGSSVSGAGAVRFGAGVAARFAAGASYAVTGRTVVNAGGNTNAGIEFLPGSSVTSVGALEVASGEADFSTGAAVTAASLTQSGGILLGSDPLTVTGPTVWTGGTMAGPTTTTAAGGLTLGAAGDAQSGQYLHARTLVNLGAASQLGGAGLFVATGGTFVNAAGATFTQSVPRSIGGYAGGSGSEPGRFVNRGAFAVAPGAGTAQVDVPFTNTGSVVVRNGTWKLYAAGKSTGSIRVNAGAAAQINKFYAGTVSGPGTITRIDGSALAMTPVTGRAVTISSGLYEVNGNVTVSSLKMTGGMLVVRGTLTVTGGFTWANGYIGGPGTISVDGGVIGTGTADTWPTLDGATLVNRGTLAQLPRTYLYQNFGSTVRNLAGATIDLRGDVRWQTDGTTTLDNAGTLRKSAGTGTARLQYVRLLNGGAVAADAGTLDLQGGGFSTGRFAAAAGATLSFGHSFAAFGPGATVGGAGTVSFGWGYWSHSFLAGSAFDVTGAVRVDTGVSFNPGSAARNFGSLAITRGGVWLATGAAVPVGSLDFSGGRLSGPDTVDVTGPTVWTGGAMGGAGLTNLRGGLTIGVDGQQNGALLDGRTVANYGAATWTGTGAVKSYNGSTFLNQTRARLDIRGGANWDGDAGSMFRNSGTVAMPATAPTSRINVPLFFNNGTLTVGAGSTLAAPQGFVQYAGTTRLDGTLDGGTYLAGGTLTGAGTVKGRLTNAAKVAVGGAVPGTLTVDGDYLQTAAGTLAVDLLGTAAGRFDVLAVTGSATLGGTLAVARPASFLPPAGSRFPVVTFARRSGGFAALTAAALPNGATFRPVYHATDLTLEVV